MPYEILTTKSVAAYLLKTKVLDYFLDGDASQVIRPDDLEVKEIGDGNLNLVFIVSHGKNPQRSIIVKQAVPYLRCAGEGYPLAKERMHYEIRALQKFKELTPAHVPDIYLADPEMCVVAMQYLGDHIIMRKGLIAKTDYPQFADHLSTFLAESLFKTSSLNLDSKKKSKLIADFNQNELRELTEKFVFTYAFMPHETNRVRPALLEDAKALWADLDFKKQVLQLKSLFMTKADALLHGDLHTGSIMLNQDETFVIDPEFAFFGPFGFDLGALLANLIMSWVSHFERSQDKAYQENILAYIKTFLEKFEQKFVALWNQHLSSPLLENAFLSASELASYQSEFMKNMLREAIGFAGCKMARRQLGLAGVEDIRDIADPVAAARAEKMALAIARELVVNHPNFNNVNDIIATLRKFADRYYPTQTNYTSNLASSSLTSFSPKTQTGGDNAPNVLQASESKLHM